ncbi:hypothetical protein Ddye_004276 [Dipteronia dyeriana]|uniref:O-fucosyltransferase family protein n=1 Tax=Dipteronia dyeriana TaxID=168575 RepID=A0AAD9XV48_9ROSI|nr:hypothetical protein Ddye_004276 [Dipteronia dyeriana]
MSIVFPPTAADAAATTTTTTATATMKKKKRDHHHHHYNHNGSIIDTVKNRIASVVYHVLFLIHRRRQLFPFVSAASGCLLLFFVAFSLLSTPPPLAMRQHHRHRHHLLQHQSSFNIGVTVESNFDKDNFFRVPKDGGNLDRDLWRTKDSKFYYGCSDPSKNFRRANVKTHPNRYLLIATSGGLNQQRTGITDAVVAAYILNATLVVPKLDHKSYWKDTSDFAEIFDVDWFISSLKRDVAIIKELPKKGGGRNLTPHNMRVPRKCAPKCYYSRVLPVLNKKHAVQLTKFDYRLANKLDTNLQKLRCRVNYHALQFTDRILEMGKILVERMRMKSRNFIALHLRFEPDMLAFSGCYYGGGDKERTELGAIRKRWKTLHVSNPDKVRSLGRCPLTPEEVGLMLRALGFGSDVHLYIASGEVYGGEETLAPLKALFPNIHSKETIASKEELNPFSSFSSRMAALDFIVCDESDVFVTNNNGNMARILAGRRRYFGHKPTIRPNAKKLSRLLMDRNNMTWVDFSSKVRTHQVSFMGEPNEGKPGRGQFHENPVSCICEDSEAKAREGLTPLLIPQKQTNEFLNLGEVNVNHQQRKDNSEVTTDDDWLDIDYLDNAALLQDKDVHTESYLDNDSLLKPDSFVVEELFSD